MDTISFTCLNFLTINNETKQACGEAEVGGSLKLISLGTTWAT
jgi:hypothetical protein